MSGRSGPLTPHPSPGQTPERPSVDLAAHAGVSAQHIRHERRRGGPCPAKDRQAARPRLQCQAQRDNKKTKPSRTPKWPTGTQDLLSRCGPGQEGEALKYRADVFHRKPVACAAFQTASTLAADMHRTCKQPDHPRESRTRKLQCRTRWARAETISRRPRGRGSRRSTSRRRGPGELQVSPMAGGTGGEKPWKGIAGTGPKPIQLPGGMGRSRVAERRPLRASLRAVRGVARYGRPGCCSIDAGSAKDTTQRISSL